MARTSVSRQLGLSDHFPVTKVVASTSRAFFSHLNSTAMVILTQKWRSLNSQEDYQDVTIRAKEIKAAALSILSQCHGVGDSRRGLERRLAPLVALFATAWTQVAFVHIAYVRGTPSFFVGEAGANYHIVNQSDRPDFAFHCPSNSYKRLGNR